MSRFASAHRAPGFWQGLFGTLTAASRLFSGVDREVGAIAQQERESDRVRLDSRLPLL